MDGASTLRATACPFLPPQGVNRACAVLPLRPRRNGEHGKGREVHWAVELVSGTRTIPPVLPSKRERLFYSQADINRWKGEHGSGPLDELGIDVTAQPLATTAKRSGDGPQRKIGDNATAHEGAASSTDEADELAAQVNPVKGAGAPGDQGGDSGGLFQGPPLSLTADTSYLGVWLRGGNCCPKFEPQLHGQQQRQPQQPEPRQSPWQLRSQQQRSQQQ